MKNLQLSIGILLVSFVLFNSLTSYSQSDNPCGAPALTVNASCTFSAGTNAGATATAGIPAPGCASYSGGDVWYQLTVPTGGAFTVDMNTGVMTDSGMAIYSGTCSSMTLIECDDDDSGNGLMSMIQLTGQTVGATLWVRIWEYGNDNNGSFQICANRPPLPPANDNCSGAYPLTVNPNYLCGSTTAGTVAGATASTQSATACGGTENDDVWFSFTATNTTHSIDLLNVAGSTTDMYHSVWSGTCPSLSLVAGTCSDPNNQTVTGLTIGTTYFIRVYTFGSTPGATSTFNVCIGTPPPPPANDNCSGAFPLTVNPNYLCGSTTFGTVAGATASSQSATACAGTENDDVWFSFTATNTSHTIDLLNVAGSTTDMYHSVWSGTCPTLSLVTGTCSDPNNQTLTGLTIGTTYFIRVYTYSSTSGATSTFNVCVGTPPPPPANDNCGGAFSLTVNPTNVCSAVTAGSVGSATASPQDATACGGTENDDVWFSFVATSNTHYISLLNIIGSTTDMYHSLWTGTCPSLSLVTGTCSDPNSQTVSGLTIGTTYFVRVYTYGSTSATTSFNVCIGTPPPTGPCGNAVNNDYCSNPAILTQGGSSWSSSTSSTYSADSPSGLSFCGSIENNSWYQFTALSTTEVFNFTNVTNCSSNWGIQAEVYSVTTSGLGCCTGFSSVSNCMNPGTNTNGTVTASGLTIGNKYILMVDGWGGDQCDFTVLGWNATGILPVEMVALHAIGMESGNLISWQTVTEKDNDYFEVLKSTNGQDFYTIGKVSGNGNSNAILNYDFFDSNKRVGTSYYRIKQYDYNGESVTSEIVAVERISEEQGIIAAYPNPMENIITLEIKSNSKINGQVEITNARGQVILSETVYGENILIQSFDVSKFEKGLYFVSYKDEQVTSTKKIIKN